MLWYYAHVRHRPAGRRRSTSRARRRAATRATGQDDQGQAKVPPGLVFHVGREASCRRRQVASAPRSRTGSSGRPRPAPCARTACRDPARRSSRRRRRAPRGLRRRRRGPRHGDALGDARRGEDGVARAAGAGGRDACSRRSSARRRSTTRYGGRFVQSVNGLVRLDCRAPRLVLLRQRHRGRPRRGRLPPA